MTYTGRVLISMKDNVRAARTTKSYAQYFGMGLGRVRSVEGQSPISISSGMGEERNVKKIRSKGWKEAREYVTKQQPKSEEEDHGRRKKSRVARRSNTLNKPRMEVSGGDVTYRASFDRRSPSRGHGGIEPASEIKTSSRKTYAPNCWSTCISPWLSPPSPYSSSTPSSIPSTPFPFNPLE